KLVFVAKNPTADMGALSESPVTLTAMAIDALGTAQATEANELLAKAQSTLETDIQLAWQFIEQARTQADLVKSQLRERMGDILTAARDTVGEMKGIGADPSQAELLLRQADGARQGTGRHGTDPDHGRAGAGGPRGPLGRRSAPSEGGGRDAPRGPQRGRIPDRPGRGDRESEGRGTPEGSVPASVPRDDE